VASATAPASTPVDAGPSFRIEESTTESLPTARIRPYLSTDR
jgi:hypothetical protein